MGGGESSRNPSRADPSRGPPQLALIKGAQREKAHFWGKDGAFNTAVFTERLFDWSDPNSFEFATGAAFVAETLILFLISLGLSRPNSGVNATERSLTLVRPIRFHVGLDLLDDP